MATPTSLALAHAIIMTTLRTQHPRVHSLSYGPPLEFLRGDGSHSCNEITKVHEAWRARPKFEKVFSLELRDTFFMDLKQP
jgi:hypothetical protein